MRVIFYNYFGNGDIFESREFVRDWMDRTPECQHLYAHGKGADLLRDMPLEWMEVEERMDPMKSVTWNGDDLLVNTWIGRDGRYVLPGIGCVVERLFQMHNDMLAEARLPALNRQVADYIPSIRYEAFGDMRIVEDLPKAKRCVLICNGPVQSRQAENFDFDPVLQIVAAQHPAVMFFHTSASNVSAPNLCSVSALTLNQISYLSRSCRVLAGRNSGPHVFSQVRENWMDGSKILMCFTYERTGACFVENPVMLGLKMRVEWSPSVAPARVARKISMLL